MNQLQAQMLGDMARPGFQAIMLKLNEYADRQQGKFDATDPFDTSAIMHIQITRHLIKIGIPAILEEIMNEGKDKEVDEPWTFWKWIKNIMPGNPGESE